MRAFIAVLLLLAAPALGSSLDRAAVKAVLQRATPRFQRCYERALAERPALAGKAIVRLEISTGGRVETVTVDFPHEVPEFTQCLREAALRLQFLKGPAPWAVAWPIHFKSGSIPPGKLPDAP